ncbi:MAG TPA: GatB/YqeY domain-containing protein [Ignavibacteriaceae bacterium]|nr:GatB/YqeY domain-containing protein [Ignavibacteriaceae bacterium]
MSLKDKINEEIKSAMKSGDKLRLETIRSIRALILEFEKSGLNKELTPEEELKMISSSVKKRKDAIEQFTNAGRTDLAQKEEAELAILMEFMPKQMSEAEVIEIVKKIAVDLGVSGKQDFGKLMPVVIKELKGKADGKIIKSIVENVLGAN